MLELGNVSPAMLNGRLNIPWTTVTKGGSMVAPSVAGTIAVYRYVAGAGLIANSAFQVSDQRNVLGDGLHVCQIFINAMTLTDFGFNIGFDRWEVILTGAEVDGESVSAVLARFGVMAKTHDPLLLGSAFAAVSPDGGVVSPASSLGQVLRPGALVAVLPVRTVATPETWSPSEVRVVESYDLGTGEFVVRGGWSQPLDDSGGFYPMTFYAAPMVDHLTDADFADDALTARVIADDAVSVGTVAIPDGGITAAKLASDAVTAIQSGLAKTSDLSSVAKTSDLTPVAKTSDLASLATAAALAALSGDVDSTISALTSVLADTANIKGRLPAALVSGKMDSTASVTGLDAGTLTALANAIWDQANGIEPGLTPRGVLRVLMAVFAGLSSGVTSGAPVFKSADVDGGGQVQGSKNRVTGVQSADDNRTSIILDTSAV